jgi:hypothetical protein
LACWFVLGCLAFLTTFHSYKLIKTATYMLRASTFCVWLKNVEKLVKKRPLHTL